MTKKDTILFFEDRKGHTNTSTTTLSSNELSFQTTSSKQKQQQQQQQQQPQPKTTLSNATKPKWHDEDDDHLKVDLLQFNRLKKLRRSEKEQFISGTEYTQRLASLRAFQKYNPTTSTSATNHIHTPAWAVAPSVKRAALEKKQKVQTKKQRSNFMDSSLNVLKPKDYNQEEEEEEEEEDLSQLDIPLPLKLKNKHDALQNENGFHSDSNDSEQEEEDEKEEEEEEAMTSNLLGEANPDISSLLRSTAPIVERSTNQLSSEALHLIRLPNVQHTHDSVITSLHFHPNCNMLLSTGRDKTLRLAHINARDNPTLAQLHFKDLALFNSAIHPSGEYVYLTGKKTYWYTYNFVSGSISRIAAFPHKEDLLPSMERFEVSPSGKYICFLGAFGHLILVDGHSKKWVTQFKQNGRTRCVAWASDELLTSLGEDGWMYVWDLRSRRCLTKWTDHENYKPGALALSNTTSTPSSSSVSWMATGSYSGIVNVYKSPPGISSRLVDPHPPSPFSSSSSSISPSTSPKAQLYQTIGNLTTPIRGVRFNHDAQLLCMWSRSKKDQLKLVHLPSARVFHNWPTQRTPLSYVETMDFSPHSSLMAIGNDKGRVLLYKLKHYEHY